MSHFYRYRQNFSSGAGKWEYVSNIDVTDLKETLDREYDWSEHYRGCDIEPIDRPPDEWLKENIALAKRSIEYHQGIIQEYAKLLSLEETADNVLNVNVNVKFDLPRPDYYPY